MNIPSANHGVILFGHGSRDPLWHKPIEAVAAQTAALSPDTPVACAYLELSTPDLATAVAGLVERQVRAVRIVPLFLGVGRHAREDLPVLVAQLRQTYPEVTFTLNKAVGEDSRLVQLLAQIAVENL
ncbi:MAG: CbiX/SirB N-terminal domain-containing protein [Burkholderiales bacterium]|jgi:sirohydrochlorin cobaltochelatase|nr:CbiX/SirB N-terminal domain-containing protein [Burkholderiales bacterium]